MNDDNVVRARVLLTSRRSQPKVTGHIVDVKIRDRRESRSLMDIVLRAMLVMILTGASLAVVGLVLMLLFVSDNFVPLWTAFILFSGLGVMMCSILLIPISGLIERYQEKAPI